MRFAAITDIHGNRAALEAVLADIDHLGIGQIVNLGDALSGPLDPGGTAELLLARDLPTVAGNHDRWLIDRPFEEMGMWERWAFPHLTEAHLDWVRSWPATLDWNGVFLCHAMPGNDETFWLDRRAPDGRMRMATQAEVIADLGSVDAPLILCGHTHIPRVIRIDGSMIANPGAVGCPAYLDGRWDPPQFDETGAADARYAVFERVNGAWIARLMTVPYDASEMIARARDNSAEDWVMALKGGWVTPKS